VAVFELSLIKFVHRRSLVYKSIAYDGNEKLYLECHRFMADVLGKIVVTKCNDSY